MNLMRNGWAQWVALCRIGNLLRVRREKDDLRTTPETSARGRVTQTYWNGFCGATHRFYLWTIVRWWWWGSGSVSVVIPCPLVDGIIILCRNWNYNTISRNTDGSRWEIIIIEHTHTLLFCTSALYVRGTEYLVRSGLRE